MALVHGLLYVGKTSLGCPANKVFLAGCNQNRLQIDNIPVEFHRSRKEYMKLDKNEKNGQGMKANIQGILFANLLQRRDTVQKTIATNFRHHLVGLQIWAVLSSRLFRHPFPIGLPNYF